MSDLGKGQARIYWKFWMEVGPDTSIPEIPQCGDVITLTDVEGPIGTRVARLLGTQFLEAWLIASGADERAADPLAWPKYLRVKIEIKDMRDDPEWVALHKREST